MSYLISLLAPFYRHIVFLLVLGGIFTAGFFKGQSHEQARSQEASLRGVIATLKADNEIARRAHDDAQAKILTLENATQDDQKRIFAYEAELSKPKDKVQTVVANQCRLDKRDIRRLRSIGSSTPPPKSRIALPSNGINATNPAPAPQGKR